MKIKKHFRKFFCTFLAGLLFFSMILADTAPVSAAEKDDSYHVLWDTDADKIHIRVKDFRVPYTCIDFPTKGYRVTNIQVSSKNLRAKVVKRSENYIRNIDEKQIITESFVSSYDCVGFYAAKKGTYDVTFDIADPSGQIVKSKSIKVYANNDEPISYVKVNDKKKAIFRSNKVQYLIVNKKDAKIEVKMNSGYKLKKIVYSYSYFQNDEYIQKIKEIKNKGKIKLNNYQDYLITITFQDKYTGRLNEKQFGISRW